MYGCKKKKKVLLDDDFQYKIFCILEDLKIEKSATLLGEKDK